MERICLCELTGMMEIIKDHGCELCNFELAVPCNEKTLRTALEFTKQQAEIRNWQVKHG